MTTTSVEPVAYPFDDGESLVLHESYRAARTAPGMFRVRLPFGEPAWLATRYADVRIVLGDSRFSRAAALENDEPRLRPHSAHIGLMSMDPPDHTRLRTLVAKAFTVRRVESLRPRIREIASSLVTDLVAAGPPADLVDAFALPLPVAVICELLGVPVEDRPRFRVWSDNALSTCRLTPQELMASRQQLAEYLAGLIAQRRADPADDLMTALIEARDEQDRLTEQEMISLCGNILIAGHETTASQIPNFVLTLLDHPGQLALLRERPDLLPGAVEELLRYVPLIAGSSFARYAKEDVQLGDVVVRAGEPVIAAISAANRDELRYDDPDALRVDREVNQHLALGHGVHHCLGAALARVELQEALRALLAGPPDLHLAGEIIWKTQMFVRGPAAMPIAW